ncbi:S-layer homology domain-containing protein [Paenibacillus sp. P96]|uniref:S-layer homology domain-containing protein n=1 Tax=Paenibacillus zeirhizosphaerae TaxID=2987519 RepID=A0ABT9FNV6_9BACL|nr:S-layer homology domain-containing protein [Paenibacillus sp. P96]MDP4096072.1 S-layer homology domain-containing protein [Paenibacillus sp. P96]
MRKLLSMLLTVALLVTMVPTAWMGKAEAASGTYFIFPSEKYSVGDARVVTTERVDLEGSFNNVDEDTISYSVYQLSKNGSDYKEVSSNVGQTGSIYPDGTELRILNVKLFSGLNKIVISGKKGSSNVSDTIYIEYRNGPTLSDLNATLNGTTVALPEDPPPAVLMANNTNKGDSSAQIVVSGYAVNASKVTISANGKSWTYNVSSSSNYKFTAGTVVVNKGNNTLTITASNNDQSVTTTREITFFNGDTTFYNTYLKQGTLTSADLSTTPDFSVDNANNIVMHGTAVVPFTGTAPASVDINYKLSGGATGTGTVTVNQAKYSQTAATHVMVPFEIPIPNSTVFDSKVRANLGITGLAGDSDLYFTLRNSAKPFIYGVNYLQGYNSNTKEADALKLTGSSMLDATTNINAVPAGIEVQVINAQADTTVVSGDPSVVVLSDVASENVNRTINGVSTNVKRFIVKVSSLPSTVKEISLKLKNGNEELETKTLKINMLYGPYVQFDSVYDGQQIKIDTNSPDQATKLKLSAVNNFSGQLFNVASESNIKYDGAGQTVFLYVNNTKIALKADGSQAKFVASDTAAAADAMVIGSNTIRFVFKSNSDEYEKTMKINITTTNVPLVPVGALGIIPFTYKKGDGGTPLYKDIAPTKSDPNFTGSEGDYTTTVSKMNIFGTFDFIDLGDNEENVDLKLKDVTDKGNYILQIESSSKQLNNGAPLKWTLENSFHSDGSPQKNYSGRQVDNLVVYYHPKEENFSFVLFDQEIPQDGSPLVYNFKLFNAGDGGPSATYRLEINFATSSYKIIRPLPDRNLINQNFVEVVVSAPNATGVEIDKEPAQKVDFDTNYDGTIEYPSAYRYVVKGLKANKETKIPIEVTVGNQVLKDEVIVKYVPANIPGAQQLDTMKKSHKAFEGALQLTFPSSTSLIRNDSYVPVRYKNQVFSNHDLLFAIANSEDGVVDRYNNLGSLDEVQLDQIDKAFDAGAQYFIGQFPDKFEKSSPVFWIDAGVADDLQTDAYDPVTYGLDPYQLSPTSPVKNFYARDTEDELVPSKRGQLTLTYSKSVAADAGKLITVLYFNPETEQWENIGGVVNNKKNTIVVPFDRFGYYVVAKLGETYTDIISHPYARNYIEATFAKGIMNAEDPSVGFKPDINITRAEFTEMIVKAQQLPFNYQGDLSFNDVSRSYTNNLWDFRYIETAARAGIVKGIQPGVFNPESNITRQDAAVIIAKALNLKLLTDRAKVEKGLAKYFKDYAEIDYYAAASVLAIAQKGFIKGSPIDAKDTSKGYNFNPTSFTLRGDAAIIVAKVMASTKKLPVLQ